jgi:hypothetical protein
MRAIRVRGQRGRGSRRNANMVMRERKTNTGALNLPIVLRMKDPEEQLKMVVEELRAQNDIRSDE